MCLIGCSSRCASQISTFRCTPDTLLLLFCPACLSVLPLPPDRRLVHCCVCSAVPAAATSAGKLRTAAGDVSVGSCLLQQPCNDALRVSHGLVDLDRAAAVVLLWGTAAARCAAAAAVCC
jgi:hypothetical protein